MAIKITSKFTLKKKLQGAASKSSKAIKKAIVKLILDDYNNGLSPVKGFNKYKKYADSTKKKKGRATPVTLSDTEQLHKSLTATQKSKTKIELSFKGARNQKIARFHQAGTDKMPKRPMLPRTGQTFKKRILDKIFKIVQKELKTIK